MGARFGDKRLDGLIDEPRLNQVERWFGFLTDQLLGRGVHKSVAALDKDIKNWIKNWNSDPTPLVRKKTAEEILDSLAKYIQRISGGGH